MHVLIEKFMLLVPVACKNLYGNYGFNAMKI